MPIQDYAYPNTRIRAMLPLLLKRGDMEALIQAKNLSEYLNHLAKSYKELSSGNEREALENSLKRDLLDTFDTIIRCSPGSSASLLKGVSERYEIEDIKIILRSKQGDGKIEILPEDEFLSGLIQAPAEGIRDILLRRYEGLNLEEDASLFDIEISLDRYYFSGLQSALTKLGREDRKIASMVISMWIDTINIPVILRCLALKEDAKRFIIPDGSLSVELMDECSALNDIQEIVSRLSNTAYGETLNISLNEYKKSNSLMHFELNLKKFFVDKNYRIMRENIFNIGASLGFLNLKRNEIENLRAVGIGISEGLTGKELREMVVMPPN